jgi:hypothetical protein
MRTLATTKLNVLDGICHAGAFVVGHGIRSVKRRFPAGPGLAIRAGRPTRAPGRSTPPI